MILQVGEKKSEVQAEKRDGMRISGGDDFLKGRTYMSVSENRGVSPKMDGL